MSTLSTELRNKLERTIVNAREVAEAGAKAALEALAVHHHEPYGHMSPDERKLRNHLRARARQLGDKQNRKSELEITHLVWECAYEHWHRMLFARFLAENELLIEPEMGVAISLEECEELAKEEGRDLWTLASEFAQRMLPQIFRPDHPLLKVSFAREHHLKLEQMLETLPATVFTASDSLGWVYQFWQSKRKRDVVESDNMIGADELPSVTQIFTEPYMVDFLIQNTIGAWWVGKIIDDNPDLINKASSEEELQKIFSLPNLSWGYLRFIPSDSANGKWHPAGGTFEEWPKQSRQLKILDPCCGSGHFLVGLLNHLVPIRMEEENIKANEAVERVISENLYGLEIDERCTQISAFALALAAWNFPNAGGYRPLPKINIACSGTSPHIPKNYWMDLAGKDMRLRAGMERLYNLFQLAPVLGSLINPIYAIEPEIFQAGSEELRPLLEIISSERTKDFDHNEMGVTALGILDAVQLLMGHYHLVITNVPYLAHGKQIKTLKDYIKQHHNDAKHDLGTVFVERNLDLCSPGGSTAQVTPQNWLFLRSYKKLRGKLLRQQSWVTVAKLGPKAFSTPLWDFNIMLTIFSHKNPDRKNYFMGLDVSNGARPKEVLEYLKKDNLFKISQEQQYKNPDSIIVFENIDFGKTIYSYCSVNYGSKPGQTARVTRQFWEIPDTSNEDWMLMGSTPTDDSYYSGKSEICYSLKFIEQNKIQEFGIRGKAAWGKKGVIISKMADLRCSSYCGEFFDDNALVIIPHNEDNLPALWEYIRNGDFTNNVRKLNQKVSVTKEVIEKTPFELNKWVRIANKKYSNGLPHSYSKDPTQWLFRGKVFESINPLQVAVARLLNFRWPNQAEDRVDEIVDQDGIVCVFSLRGENQADERIREILSINYGKDWSLSKETELIARTGSKAQDLVEWLRDDFFEHHCKLFRHRPFVWHIWDGRRRDGFHALVNYHKLAEGNGKGRQLLESLTYSYLGDWITRQKEGVKRGEGGAEDRLATALELQKCLIAIIEGKPPFDIFVRWKPIEKQPIGWEPDINDGVRLNIRPFMAQDIPGGRKGAGILRWKPNIKWNKDRGKDVASAPWFALFKGDRINDHHLSLEEKRGARERMKAEG